MLNVIMCVYNNIEVAGQSITSVISQTNVPCKIILVDNHSFDSRTRDYLKKIPGFQEDITVVDPGKNLGCHWGWNFGFQHTKRDYPFTCKIDDDTIVPPNWASTMINAHKIWWKHKQKAIGILGANVDCRNDGPGEVINLDGYFFEIPPVIISFSCVMFLTDMIYELGPMRGSNYRTALGRNIVSDQGENLYGGEETYYLDLVRQKGYDAFWLQNVLVHHMGTSKKDWNYLLWKFSYGYLGLMRKNFDEFMRDDVLVQQSWHHLIKSRIVNPQCVWYGESVDHVVEAFRQVCVQRSWNFQKLLANIGEYKKYKEENN